MGAHCGLLEMSVRSLGRTRKAETTANHTRRWITVAAAKTNQRPAQRVLSPSRSKKKLDSESMNSSEQKHDKTVYTFAVQSEKEI